MILRTIKVTITDEHGEIFDSCEYALEQFTEKTRLELFNAKMAHAGAIADDVREMVRTEVLAALRRNELESAE